VANGDAAFPQRLDVQLAPGPAQVIQADDLAGGNIIEQTVGKRAPGEPTDSGDQNFHAGFLLLAPGLHGRNAGKVRRQTFGFEGLGIHLDQANKWTAIVRSLSATSVDDDADAGNFAAMRADDVDRFLDASASGYDVFGHDEPLVGPNLKTTPEDEAAHVFFHENVPFPERAAHFLADNDATKGRGDDGVAFESAQFIREPSTNIGGNVGMLQKQRALEKLPAVQARAQNEMALKQRPSPAKERKQILAH
jgi:hypothetical protein